MKIIHEIKCPQCGKIQKTNIESLWGEDLFWQPCEFCKRYGLYRTVRKKLTSIREWMMFLYLLCGNHWMAKSFSSSKEG